MLPITSDLLKWVVFTNEERSVLLEAFNNFFPVPELALLPASEDDEEEEDYSARLDLQTDKRKLQSLQTARSLLLASLRRGPNAVISLTAFDCAALSALVMLEVAGFYDYLISLEASLTELEVEFFPADDERQVLRFRILNQLNN